MKSYVGALIQYDWYPYKERKFGHRHIQKEDHMKTQGENSHLQAKEKGYRRNQPYGRFYLRLPISRTVRIQVSVVYASQFAVLGYGSPSKPMHHTFPMTQQIHF